MLVSGDNLHTQNNLVFVFCSSLEHLWLWLASDPADSSRSSSKLHLLAGSKLGFLAPNPRKLLWSWLCLQVCWWPGCRDMGKGPCPPWHLPGDEGGCLMGHGHTTPQLEQHRVFDLGVRTARPRWGGLRKSPLPHQLSVSQGDTLVRATR